MVHIRVIATVPSQSLAGSLLEAAQIDIAFGENLARLGSEVGSNGRDDAYRREKARSDRKVRRRTTEHIENAAVGGLDSIVSDRADHQKIHMTSRIQIPFRTPTIRCQVSGTNHYLQLLLSIII